jgi:hypothetical protein
MSDPKYHDRHTAGIYRAIALRFYCRYVEMRHSAEHQGGDLSNHGKLPSERAANEEYTAAIDEWLFEAPASATAALALVEFAGVVTADRFLGEVLRDQIMSEDRDGFYQTVALSTAARWLNELAMSEFVERVRGGLAVVPSDGGDAA